MQALYFTLVGILLYLGSDWLLGRIEQARGKRFAQRSIVFFAILLPSAVIAFALIRGMAD